MMSAVAHESIKALQAFAGTGGDDRRSDVILTRQDSSLHTHPSIRLGVEGGSCCVHAAFMTS